MEVVFDLPRRVCLADPGLPCYSASRPSPSRMIASHGHSKLLPMPTGSITRLPPLHLLLFVLSPMLCSTTSCLTISDDLPNLVHMLWCKKLNVSCPSIRCYCSSRWFDVSSRSGSSPAFLLLEKDRDPQSLLPSSTPELSTASAKIRHFTGRTEVRRRVYGHAQRLIYQVHYLL